LGVGSGIIGVKIDGLLAFKMLQELCGGDIPVTWTFKTPGSEDGHRLLFRVPEGIHLAAIHSSKR